MTLTIDQAIQHLQSKRDCKTAVEELIKLKTHTGLRESLDLGDQSKEFYIGYSSAALGAVAGFLILYYIGFRMQ